MYIQKTHNVAASTMKRVTAINVVFIAISTTIKLLLLRPFTNTCNYYVVDVSFDNATWTQYDKSLTVSISIFSQPKIKGNMTGNMIGKKKQNLK